MISMTRMGKNFDSVMNSFGTEQNRTDWELYVQVAYNCERVQVGIVSVPNNYVSEVCNSGLSNVSLASVMVARNTWVPPSVASSEVCCMRAQRGAVSRRG